MTAGQETHIRHFGQGPRRVLAIHCTLSHGGAWRGLAEALCSEITLTACDLPGHGHSADWDGTTDLAEMCRQALLPELHEGVDVIGHSFGAVLALWLAMEYPERVRSLCLIEPVLFAAAGLDEPEVLSAYSTQYSPIGAAFRAGDLALAARLFNREWGDGRKWPDIPERTRSYIEARMSFIPAQDGILLRDGLSLLSRQRLDRVAMPVLLVGGDKSPPVVGAIERALASRLKTVQRVAIAGAGHMAPITHPLAVAAVYARFLETVEEPIELRPGDRPVAHEPR